MADGYNEARALRVSEIMRDYQSIQQRISHCQTNPRDDEYNEIGHVTLRQCQTEARSLLNQQFPIELLHPPTGPNEAEKRQLQRVLLDASSRRLRAQKILLRATAAMKWVKSRNDLLHGQKPKNGDVARLQQYDSTLRGVCSATLLNVSGKTGALMKVQDLTTITEQRIIHAFRTKDQQAGYWLNDDPSLAAIQGWIRSHH